MSSYASYVREGSENAEKLRIDTPLLDRNIVRLNETNSNR